MSDTVLKLIPVSPSCRPDSRSVEKASDLLSSFLPEAEKVAFDETEKVRFIDPGQNLERVICPACGTELEMAWWQKAMKEAYQSDFADLSISMPCCDTVSSLNDLQYEWPAGFARFHLQVLNPNGRLEQTQLKQLEAILGCAVREIWAHY